VPSLIPDKLFLFVWFREGQKWPWKFCW